MSANKLIWEEKYSVGVKQIDEQHKMMFRTINELIDVLSGVPTVEQVDKIITALVSYKQYHFATEEKYFDEFGYQGAADHKQKHADFSRRLEEIKKETDGDIISLAFKLVDFLEDWLIDHLMITDQQYVSCFKEHGLK